MTDKKSETNAQEPDRTLFEPNLLPKFTFDTFVVGDCNRFAHEVSLKVSESPGVTYNPLLIHGSCGLGTTHLLQAIGNKVLQRSGTARIYCFSTERFMNAMINAMRFKRMQTFRNSFHDANLLLIDDIQFMTDKSATQDSFLHIFNALHDANIQIVITADKTPEELEGFDEHLRSRLAGCLVAGISKPDYETRTAILKKKAEMSNVAAPDEVLQLLAEVGMGNIRELEGLLIKVGAYSALMKVPITIEMARKIVSELYNVSRSRWMM